MTQADTTTETKRDRVRRILIDPVVAGGMRKRRETSDDDHKRFLNRLCDDMAYMSDAGLGALRRWVEAHGDGKARCFWPGFVPITTIANAFEPRPLEEMPELASWFGSRAGLEAAAVPGRLVLEFRFLQRHRRPPIRPHEIARIGQEAAALAADVARARELRAAGRVHDDDLLFAFERDEARAEALLAAPHGEVMA